MSRTSRQVKDLVIEYLLEIGVGNCSITDDAILREQDEDMREIMTGLLFLSEELQLKRQKLIDAHEATRRAMEIAEASSEAKSRFLANVSHELRTPMNGILGMTGFLLQTAMSPEQQYFANTILTSAHSLLSIIDDILDMAHIESDTLPVRAEPFDLETTLVALVDRFVPSVGGKGLSLSLVCQSRVPRYLVGDGNRIGQILGNYVDNAIKFTEYGTIALEVGCDALDGDRAHMHFAVVDTGVGIHSDKLEMLFQPFSQIDATMKREFSGTGLGLAICKQLAGLLSGEVGVDSLPGRGSTFWLRVPLAVDRVRSTGFVTQGRRSWPRGATLATDPTELPAPAQITSPSASDLRILVVEDNSINRVVATRLLQQLGCHVETAVDGRDGVRRAAEGVYDIIFMDCQMPGMDGFEATAAIRAQMHHGADVRIVAMTAHAMAGDRARCLAAGMDDYLTKPVSSDELASVLWRNRV